MKSGPRRARATSRPRRPKGRPTMPQSAAAPSPFTPIAEYAFLSDCHTGALVAPDGTIDWRRSRALTRRACSGRCSTAEPGRSVSVRSGLTCPAAGPTSRGPTRGDRVEDPAWVGDRARRAGDGPRRGEDTITRTRVLRPTRMPSTCSCGPSRASTAASRSSSCASRGSTTAAVPGSGR